VLRLLDPGIDEFLTAWRDEGPRGPRVLGGLILPGAAACARALTGAVPHLPTVEPVAEDSDPLQTSTQGALAAALGIGYPAMVARCVERLAAAVGSELVVATGGLGRRWLSDAVYRRDLVLDGLGRLV